VIDDPALPRRGDDVAADAEVCGARGEEGIGAAQNADGLLRSGLGESIAVIGGIGGVCPAAARRR